RHAQRRKDPGEQLNPQLAGPPILAMRITSIYNMADTFFVSQLGTSASGAVGIIYSAMALIQAFAFMIGMGAGNNISRLLGNGEEKEAQKYASVAWFTGFVLGCVVSLLGMTLMKPIVMLLGSTETIAPYAIDYARYIFLAAPFMICSLIMNNLLRFQGLAVYSMVGITTGGILNMVLDPILIFGLGMGTMGAGVATGFSQFVSFCILLFMCNTHRDAIRITPRNYRPSVQIYGRILYTGAPSLARQGIGSISSVMLNSIAGSYGDAAIAAMSIVSRFTMFINSVVIGFGQGFQPVCAFNFGAKKYDRVKQSFWFCVKVATITLLVLCGISLLFSGHIITLFRRDDAEVIAIGTFALRAQLITMPLWGYYIMCNMFSQSIGYGFRSSVISCARQGLFLIPVLAVFPRFFGLRGLQISQPVSDILAFLLAFVLVSGILKEIDKKQYRNTGRS
ncbi:MAG: MATE family efflux transporter, partial [Lachnospiraceae bacterium]|nr:MATE family efflux transporter [Lachnospiraceae bacterium]